MIMIMIMTMTMRMRTKMRMRMRMKQLHKNFISFIWALLNYCILALSYFLNGKENVEAVLFNS